MIKINDTVIIKDNLTEELMKLDFEEYCVENMKELIGTIQTVYSLWVDEDTNQQYTSIDLCVEIPVQCLEIRP